MGEATCKPPEIIGPHHFINAIPSQYIIKEANPYRDWDETQHRSNEQESPGTKREILPYDKPNGKSRKGYDQAYQSFGQNST